MSPDADPANPDAKYVYVAHAMRDWYDDAVERAEKDPKWEKNYSRARKFVADRVDL